MRPAGHHYCVARAKPCSKAEIALEVAALQHPASTTFPESFQEQFDNVFWRFERERRGIFISRWTRNEKEDEKLIKDGRDIEEKFEDCVKLAISLPGIVLFGD
jgi:hypothetical protein